MSTFWAAIASGALRGREPERKGWKITLRAIVRTVAQLLCMAGWAAWGLREAASPRRILRERREARHQAWVARMRFRAREQATELPAWHLNPERWAYLRGERGYRQ